MLVNFLSGLGCFSFKIAFDETMSRFSPGVLIEIDNLRQVLNRDDLDWMDSCDAADHPMIDSLWGEHRQIVQYRVALRGVGRSIAWTAADAADRLATFIKRPRAAETENRKRTRLNSRHKS